MKHFELTTEKIKLGKRTLYRIRALVDLPRQNVKKGDLGGFVESIDNLDDNAWVFGNALVCGDVRVYGNAQVYDNALVYEHARVCGNALVCGEEKVDSRGVVHLSGLRWPVTMAPVGMRIGCQWHPIEFWKKAEASDKKISKMHSEASEFWAEHKEALLSIWHIKFGEGN